MGMDAAALPMIRSIGELGTRVSSIKAVEVGLRSRKSLSLDLQQIEYTAAARTSDPFAR